MKLQPYSFLYFFLLLNTLFAKNSLTFDSQFSNKSQLLKVLYISCLEEEKFIRGKAEKKNYYKNQLAIIRNCPYNNALLQFSKYISSNNIEDTEKQLNLIEKISPTNSQNEINLLKRILDIKKSDLLNDNYNKKILIENQQYIIDIYQYFFNKAIFDMSVYKFADSTDRNMLLVQDCIKYLEENKNTNFNFIFAKLCGILLNIFISNMDEILTAIDTIHYLRVNYDNPLDQVTLILLSIHLTAAYTFSNCDLKSVIFEQVKSKIKSTNEIAYLVECNKYEKAKEMLQNEFNYLEKVKIISKEKLDDRILKVIISAGLHL